MAEPITAFTGKYRFLSNFFLALVIYDSVRYTSVENAYQAAKTLDKGARTPFRSCTAGEAKHAGKLLRLRPDWDQVKLPIMEDLVHQKFTGDAWLREALLETGEAELIEGNTWGDRFWGQCPVGNGENHLGEILMKVRHALQVPEAPKSPTCDAWFSHSERITRGEGKCGDIATHRMAAEPHESSHGGPWLYSCADHAARNPWNKWGVIPCPVCSGPREVTGTPPAIHCRTCGEAAAAPVAEPAPPRTVPGAAARLAAVLALGTPWPLGDVLRRLVHDVEHLLQDHSCDHLGWELSDHARTAATAILVAVDGAAAATPPIDMVLHCPRCSAQHIDAPTGDWTNPPHRSHLCSACKLIWRPADVPTNGVRQTQTHGSADTPIVPLVLMPRPGASLTKSIERERFAIYECDPVGSNNLLLVFGRGATNVVNGAWHLEIGEDGLGRSPHVSGLGARLIGYVEDAEYSDYNDLLEKFQQERALWK
jgi:hypothetical protein